MFKKLKDQMKKFFESGFEITSYDLETGYCIIQKKYYGTPVVINSEVIEELKQFFNSKYPNKTTEPSYNGTKILIQFRNPEDLNHFLNSDQFKK